MRAVHWKLEASHWQCHTLILLTVSDLIALNLATGLWKGSGQLCRVQQTAAAENNHLWTTSYQDTMSKIKVSSVTFFIFPPSVDHQCFLWSRTYLKKKKNVFTLNQLTSWYILAKHPLTKKRNFCQPDGVSVLRSSPGWFHWWPYGESLCFYVHQSVHDQVFILCTRTRRKRYFS